MAQPAPAPQDKTVTITYHPGPPPYWTGGGNISIPKSGLVRFDIDPENAPPCLITCTLPSSGAKDSAPKPAAAGGFTIDVGTPPRPGGEK